MRHDETGQTRIAAGRLVDIARALNTPTARLFCDEGKAKGAEAPDGFGLRADLLAAFTQLPRPEQSLLVEVARAMMKRGTQHPEENAAPPPEGMVPEHKN